MNKTDKAMPVEELLGWCDSVAEVGWRAKDDADLTLVELFERETAESEVETAEVASCGGCGQEANARLVAAAPDLYRAARRAAAYLEHSSMVMAQETRSELLAALGKAGGFGKGKGGAK